MIEHLFRFGGSNTPPCAAAPLPGRQWCSLPAAFTSNSHVVSVPVCRPHRHSLGTPHTAAAPPAIHQKTPFLETHIPVVSISPPAPHAPYFPPPLPFGTPTTRYQHHQPLPPSSDAELSLTPFPGTPCFFHREATCPP